MRITDPGLDKLSDLDLLTACNRFHDARDEMLIAYYKRAHDRRTAEYYREEAIRHINEALAYFPDDAFEDDIPEGGLDMRTGRAA